MFKEVFKDSVQVAKELYKVLIPLIIVIKVLEMIGAVELLAQALSPLMELVGLPGAAGIVWAAAIVTNMYGGLATLVSLFDADSLTVAQATILGSMILLCHSLPVETALSKKVGANPLICCLLRFFGALLYGAILYAFYSHFQLFEEPTQFSLPPIDQNQLWVVSQLKNLVTIFVILFCLLTLMKILEKLGVTKLLSKLLSPVLTIFGISSKASTISIFGLVAGITFGSGLIIGEAKKNSLSTRDILITMYFLNLCHGLIEDTLLMVLIGGDLSGLLWGRIVFSLIILFFMTRDYKSMSLRFSAITSK